MNQLIEDRYCPRASEIEGSQPASTLGFEVAENHRLVVVEWCALALLALLLIWHSFLPGWANLGSEFPDYYLAAEIHHRGIPLDRIYEWPWFQRQNDHLGVRSGLVSFAPNPPTSVFTMLPVAGLEPLVAKRVWMMFNLLFLGLSLWALRLVTVLSWRRLILISLLCILPFSVEFMFARQYIFVLFLVCAAYYSALRNRNLTSGMMWAAATATKLFPALALILFVRKRQWRIVAGFSAGVAFVVVASIFVFGLEVHRVFLYEVLSQASRGDWLGPYVLSQNSFITLWSHLFLVEPELNPSPVISSPTLYAVALAITVVVPVFAFLLSVKKHPTAEATALHWAAVVPLMLLLSTSTSADHSVLLIFSAIVGFDVLLARRDFRTALILLLLYTVACAPIPARLLHWFPLYRLAATLALYALLLRSTGLSYREFTSRRWLSAAFLCAVILIFYNLRTVRNRAEDFSRRIATHADAYRFANPVPVADKVAFTEMLPHNYAIAFLGKSGFLNDVPMTGDALSIAGSSQSDVFYSELAGEKSILTKMSLKQPGSPPEKLTEGQDPALSPNGKWLVFVREEQQSRSAWLMATDSSNSSQLVLSASYRPLDVAVTDDGDLIAAAGNVSDPQFLLVRHGSREIVTLPEFGHPVRYPSISPDGLRLSFCRRESGSWHLFVRTFVGGAERQITHAHCNVISPSWENDQTLLYATDCGRGIGLSGLARVILPN